MIYDRVLWSFHWQVGWAVSILSLSSGYKLPLEILDLILWDQRHKGWDQQGYVTDRQEL